jgi:hypothetical protein
MMANLRLTALELSKVFIDELFSSGQELMILKASYETLEVLKEASDVVDFDAVNASLKEKEITPDEANLSNLENKIRNGQTVTDAEWEEFVRLMCTVRKDCKDVQIWKALTLQGTEGLVVELTEQTTKHIHKGEIKYLFKDARLPNGKKEFIFTPDEIWNSLKSDYEANGDFTKLLFDNTYNKPSIDFSGMHNYDNFTNFTHPTSPTGKLFNSSGKEIVGTVSGKNAYKINDPAVWVPDLEDLVSKNKARKIENRVWEGTGKWQLKKVGSEGRISNTFIENMTDAEINQMVSDAFKVSDKGAEWEGIITYQGKRITINGYFRNGKIESSFITKIQ